MGAKQEMRFGQCCKWMQYPVIDPQLRDQQELDNHREKQKKRTRQEFEEKKAKAARTFAYGTSQTKTSPMRRYRPLHKVVS